MCIFPRAKGKKPKELISQLRSSDLIPPYHADFLENFYRLIQWVPTIRNNEGAHGPGAEPRKVTPALAEFALHMTYAVVLFLLKRYAEKYPMPPAEEAPPPPPEEGYEDTDLPF
ncbi:MAG: abortive infection family protein [Bacteroidia bacterium]|nr:abortive infection family protein [Bacteroidia bacterium]